MNIVIGDEYVINLWYDVFNRPIVETSRHRNLAMSFPSYQHAAEFRRTHGIEGTIRRNHERVLHCS